MIDIDVDADLVDVVLVLEVLMIGRDEKEARKSAAGERALECESESVGGGDVLGMATVTDVGPGTGIGTGADALRAWATELEV